MQKYFPITSEGLIHLKEEKEKLLEKRPRTVESLRFAREMGDLSENAEYESARDKQAFVESRIKDIEEIFKNVQIISENAKTDKVGVGSTVRVHIDGDEEEFYIVGAPEADPMKKKISHESPLGLALIGKKIGEKVSVEAPIGTLTYTILEIK